MEAVIIIIVYLIMNIICGCITKYLASTKGYDGGFAWGFWLGIIGVLVVGFRLTIQQTPSYVPSALSHPQPVKRTHWECACGAKNP